jgi:uncharacterized protein (TIGR03437 family)
LRSHVAPAWAVCALVLSGVPGFSQQFLANRYTLILADPPVSGRFATRAQMATAQADAYRLQIESKQNALVAELATRNIPVLGRTSTVLNAIFVNAPASRLPELQSLPGVIDVQPARRMKLNLNKALTLMNAPAAWTAVGGQSNAGKGIKIAVIDSGIDQTHSVFQDPSLSMPSGFPKCTTGHPEDCSFTNSKVIVARSYLRMETAGTDPKNPAANSFPDDASPRDHFGHGTGNAAAAAGLPVAAPSQAIGGGQITIGGMAPKAWLGNYKVFGSIGVFESASDQGLIAAVNDAVNDGMDVVTCSIGSPAINDLSGDLVAQAFESAVIAGVVVVTAAGNYGTTCLFDSSGSCTIQHPTFNSIVSPGNAPDVISVGATITSHVLSPSVSVNASSAPSTLKNIPANAADSYFAPSSFGATVAPLIDVSTLGNDGLACSALPAGSLNGAFALILRGTCGFDTKALNAQNAGAIGFIFYMADSSSPIFPSGINEIGPGVMIANSSGLALKNYLASNPSAVVTIDLSGIESDIVAWGQAQAAAFQAIGQPITINMVPNVLASYSSLGPSPEGLLKPDLVATGGGDQGFSFYFNPPGGMYTATQSYDPGASGQDEVSFYGAAGGLYSANGYIAWDGTSIATPLVAGAAALMKQAHPNLPRPGTQIKSLLVNSAAQDTTQDDSGDTVDAEWIGGGRLDAGAASKAFITVEPPCDPAGWSASVAKGQSPCLGNPSGSSISFGYLNSSTKFPVTQNVKLTNISSGSVTVAVAVNCCSTVGGKPTTLTIAASPTSVTLAGNASATVAVTLTGTLPPAGEYSGTVTLTGSGITETIPFMLLVGNSVVYTLAASPGGEGTPGTDFGSFTVQNIDANGVPVAGTNVNFSVTPRSALTFKSVTGKPACSPASSSTTISCPSDQFGVAWVDVTLGSRLGPSTVTVTSSGVTTTGNFNVQAAPNVTGVSDAAVGQTPVAPGSYVSIYGSGLSNSTDSNTFLRLPMHIDFVTVSFDVPSKGISVPGRLTYVSPAQVNVQIPWELQGQSSAQMKVTLDGDLFGNVVNVPLADQSPTFFVYSTNIAIAQDSNYALIGASNPAKRGQAIVLYANGLGPVNNQPASGDSASATNLASTKQTASVNIGGQDAQVLFAGLSPGFPGLYQINVMVPQGVTPGTAVPITVSIGGATSPQATLPVQ